jgi:acetyl esterase
MAAMADAFDDQTIAPSAGLSIRTERVVSAPHGNKINIQFIRPDNAARVLCIYYIHGGGAIFMSCYSGNYRAWDKVIAANGAAVAMVDFRNALIVSSVMKSRRFRRASMIVSPALRGFTPAARRSKSTQREL